MLGVVLYPPPPPPPKTPRGGRGRGRAGRGRGRGRGRGLEQEICVGATKKRPSEELTNGSRSGTLNKRELLPPSAPFGASTNYAMGHSMISILSILAYISSAIGSRKASVQILIPSNFTKRCYQTKIYYPPKKPGRSSLDVEDWRCVSVLPMLAPVVVGGV